MHRLRLKTSVFLLWIAGVCPVPAQTTMAPTDAEEAAAVAWFRAASHHFSDATPSPAEADTFVKALGEARIYGLGEATHGGHQDQAFKSAVIKALVRAGHIDMLALECNRLGATGLDQYVRGGPGDVVALLRDRNFFGIWRNDEFAGLIVWLRAWNQTARQPVRVVGVDNQNANRDVAEALAFIRLQDPSAYRRLAEPLQGMLSREGQEAKFYRWVIATPRQAFDQAATGIDAVTAELQSRRSDWGQVPGFDEALYAARVARQGMHVFEMEAGNPGVDLSTLPVEYANRRDVAMAANLEALSARQRVALWAHDSHVLSALDAQAQAHGYVTMGSELRRRIGSAYVSVGFAWSRGSFNAAVVSAANSGALAAQATLSPQSPPNDRDEDLGRVLARTDLPRFWIDLRLAPADVMAWGAKPTYRGWAGFAYDATKWQSDPDDRMALMPSHDFLVYFRTLTPSSLWPVVP